MIARQKRMINKTITGTSRPVEIQYKMSDIRFIVIDNLMRYLFFYCFTLFSLFLFRMFHQRRPRIPPANAMIMTPANAFQSISLTPAAEVFPLTVATIPRTATKALVRKNSSRRSSFSGSKWRSINLPQGIAARIKAA